MKKGDLLRSNTTNEFWEVTEGETFKALSDEVFYNGEFQIETEKGWIPSVFFYNIKDGEFVVY